MSDPLFSLEPLDDECDADCQSGCQSAAVPTYSNTTSQLPMVGEWIQRFEASQNAKGGSGAGNSSAHEMDSSAATEIYRSHTSRPAELEETQGALTERARLHLRDDPLATAGSATAAAFGGTVSLASAPRAAKSIAGDTPPDANRSSNEPVLRPQPLRNFGDGAGDAGADDAGAGAGGAGGGASAGMPGGVGGAGTVGSGSPGIAELKRRKDAQRDEFRRRFPNAVAEGGASA